MLEKEKLINKEVLDYLDSVRPLSKEARQFLIDHLTRREIKKKTILLKPKETCTTLWYIAEGVMGAYEKKEEFDEKKKEKRSFNWIMLKHDIATSVVSFFEQTPTDETVVALENCVIYSLSRKDLFAGLEKHPSLLMLTLLQTIKYYCQSRKFEAALRKKTPEEMYRYLKKNYPELIKGITTVILAAFMGISRSTMYLQIPELKKDKAPAKKASKKRSGK